MSQWQPIESAPKDGTVVIAATEGRFPAFAFPYPLPSRFDGGRWTADFGEQGWQSYDPQPTHWKPALSPSGREDSEIIFSPEAKASALKLLSDAVERDAALSPNGAKG